MGLASPEEFDKTLFKVGAGRDDTVDRVGPDDEYAFIALSERVSKTTITLLRRTMKAAHWSFSAFGRWSMVSRTWMRVSTST